MFSYMAIECKSADATDADVGIRGLRLCLIRRLRWRHCDAVVQLQRGTTLSTARWAPRAKLPLARKEKNKGACDAAILLRKSATREKTGITPP